RLVKRWVVPWDNDLIRQASRQRQCRLPHSTLFTTLPHCDCDRQFQEDADSSLRYRIVDGHHEFLGTPLWSILLFEFATILGVISLPFCEIGLG
ncbi:hypothetical protein BHE74_00059781, partial [Ensete ventricosum]